MTWADLVDRVKITFQLPLEVRALVNRRQPDEVQLHVKMTVKDINGGEQLAVHIVDYPPPIDHFEDLHEAAHYLRNFVLRALAHELDETFLVDGVKLTDPHTQETYIPRHI